MSVQDIRHNHILIEQDRRSHKGVALRERRDWITTEIDLTTVKSLLRKKNRLNQPKWLAGFRYSGRIFYSLKKSFALEDLE